MLEVRCGSAGCKDSNNKKGGSSKPIGAKGEHPKRGVKKPK